MKYILLSITLILSVSLVPAQKTYTSFKEALKSANNVEVLDLSNQKLRSISKKIAKFPNLRVLNLSGNKLISLPSEFEELYELDSLDLSRNSFIKVPKVLQKNYSLKWLNLSLNPVDTDPQPTPSGSTLLSGVFKLQANGVKVITTTYVFDIQTQVEAKTEEKFVFAETLPEPLNLDELKRLYRNPEVSKDFKNNGFVVVRVQVDPNGNYEDHKVLQSNDEAFQAYLLKEIQGLKFKPATAKGKPLSFWVNLSFRVSS